MELFYDLYGVLDLVVARRGADVDDLVDDLGKLIECEGRLSKALGSRKPCATSTSLRERSPAYMPRIWGMVMWLSSMITIQSAGK